MADDSPDAQPELSTELVRRIHAGDRAAWDGLYRRYHDALLFTVRARLGPRLRSCLQSEDVLQSVFEDALRDLEQFEPRGPGSLRHWLHACVENKIRARADYHDAGLRGRVESAGSRLDALDAGEDVDYFESDRFGRLELALDRLPADMREVVILRAVEGLSNVETASLVGRTPEAASKLYNRALARLGGMIAPQERS